MPVSTLVCACLSACISGPSWPRPSPAFVSPKVDHTYPAVFKKSNFYYYSCFLAAFRRISSLPRQPILFGLVVVANDDDQGATISRGSVVPWILMRQTRLVQWGLCPLRFLVVGSPIDAPCALFLHGLGELLKPLGPGWPGGHGGEGARRLQPSRVVAIIDAWLAAQGLVRTEDGIGD